MWRILNFKTLGVGCVFLVGVLLFAGGAQVRDPDFWWHVTTGQWIVGHWSLPGHDLYTFWANPSIWTDHEWLSEVLLWRLYSLGGAVVIVLAFVCLGLVGLVFMLKRAEMSRPPYLILVGLLLLGLLAAGPIWGPRAQMLEFLFVAIELYWLERYLTGKAQGWAGIYALPFLMVFWANLHGSWPVAFLFLGAAMSAQGYAYFVGHQGPAGNRLQRLLLVTAGSALALLLTPNGPSLLLYPFQTQGSAAQQSLIEEWFSPDFHQIFLRPFELLLFVGIVIFWRARPNLYGSLLFLGSLGLALQSVRHITLFVVASTPVMVAGGAQIWQTQTLPWLQERRGAWTQLGQMGITRPLHAILTLVTWTGLGVVVSMSLLQGLQGQGAFERSDYPVAASNYILAHPQMCTRMYNQYGWGGYLIYRLYPSDHKAYIFGEAALMGDQRLYNYEQITSVGPHWQDLLASSGVDCVVYNRDTALTDALKVASQWQLIYEDANADIFVPRSSAPQ